MHHANTRRSSVGPASQFAPCAAPPQVESYFASIGILLPGWHTAYWTALRTRNASEPRDWSFMDPFPVPFSGESYSHWGDSQPDNAQPPESCVAASYPLRYQSGTPGAGAWGWDDQPCSTRLLVMCRITRGCWRRAAAVEHSCCTVEPYRESIRSCTSGLSIAAPPCFSRGCCTGRRQGALPYHAPSPARQRRLPAGHQEDDIR